MSILPGSGAPVGADARDEADRIARLALGLTAARFAAVVVGDAVGTARAHRLDAATADELEQRALALCAATVADGVLRVVPSDTGLGFGRPGVGDTNAPVGTMAHVCVPVRGHGSREGTDVGAICVLDDRHRSWGTEQVAAAIDLAQLSAAGLAMHDLAAEREQARAELEREHAFLEGVLENLTDGVAACDSEGRLAYFNPALREIHGLPEQTLSTTDWADAYDLCDADGERPLRPEEVPLARAFHGETVRNQHIAVRAGHRRVQHFLATGSPITGSDGSTLGAVVSMHDISADIRRRRIRTAHLAAATALADDQSGDEAIATALHHLRDALTPATAAVVMVGTVADPDIDKRVVTAVLRSGESRQAELTHPFSGFVLCAPIRVATSVVGVVYLAGPAADLLDDLSGSVAEGVAGLLGRFLERERSDRLDRELRATRHDLERVIRHAQDFVWSLELVAGEAPRLRTTSSPRGVLGGADEPASGGWTAMLADRVHPDDLPALLGWRDAVVAGRPGEFTCRVRGADGLVRSVRTRCSIRVADGRRFVDGISSDVTGQTRFEMVRSPADPAEPVLPPTAR